MLSLLVSRMLNSRLALCAVALLIGGCASIPENIRTPVPGPNVAQVRANPGPHMGQKVRWGGTISAVSNLENRTVITVVDRPITRSGEPLADERSTGRFIAEAKGFLDPDVYKPGRRITVVGHISGIRSSKIGEYVYDYPVVQADALYLWQEYTKPEPYPYPYYPWPYYDPFWPYPYYHRFPGYPWYY